MSGRCFYGMLFLPGESRHRAGGRRQEMPGNRAEFTKAMRRTHTIYMPDMLPYHGQLFRAAFRFAGYRLKIVPYAAA